MTAHSNPILSSIITISEKLEGSKLSDDVLKEISEPLSIVSEHMNLDTTEALFLAIIFALHNQDNRPVNLHQIADFLDYPFLHLLEYRYVIDSLEDKSFIYMAERRNVSPHAENNGYGVCGSVSNCVIEGKPVIMPKAEEFDLETAITEVLFIEDAYQEKLMDATEYMRQIITFENKVQHLELFKNILDKFSEDLESRIMLYFFSYSVICGVDYESPVGHGSRRQCAVFNYLSDSARIKRRRSFIKGDDILLQNKLVEKFYCEVDGPMAGAFISFKLSDTGIKELFGKSAVNYISPEDDITELDKIISRIREFASVYEQKTSVIGKTNSLMDLDHEAQQYDYFEKFTTFIPKDTWRWMYYDCVCDFINGHESDLTKTIRDMYGHGVAYFRELRSFIDEKHFLLENGFLEIEQNEVVEKTKLTLTDKSIELLYGENADLYKRKASSTNVLNPEDLKEKTLFYSDDVQSQINMLGESLEQEKLTSIQNRLESKGLSKGVVAIFYGAPGTGKSETVYQLAKKTNRKVLHVDISESKSMWFGESEKRIKKIFTDYRALCKTCKHHGENTPILLFNEADALISKRNNLEGGGPRQTENAMQNILLEEMENLDGIMIATTNLCENMDAAFERRFLFKIKYEKPSVEARSKIWMNKLNYISEGDAVALAEQFDFSGGEIDNIVRKGEMDEIITGNQPDYERLAELCKKERLEKAGERRVGFAC